MGERLGTCLVDLALPDPPGSDVVHLRFDARTVDDVALWQVWRDDEECETVIDSYAVPYAMWELTRLALEATVDVLPMHAAALSLDGRTIVLAGVSTMGKSTLAGWLTAHGWGFLTDELAIIAPNPAGGWLVRPFPRPIGVRHPSPLDALVGWTPKEPESLLSASRLGSLSPAGKLTAIILPTRNGGGGPRDLERIHPATALREMWEHLPNRERGGRPGFEKLVSLLREVPVYRLGVDDLAATERTLRSFVAGVGA